MKKEIKKLYEEYHKVGIKISMTTAEGLYKKYLKENK